VLAFFDMGIYDRVAIDGWQYINKALYKTSRWFDETIVDGFGVDGTGGAVKIVNLFLRMAQSGRIQFYFIVTIIVLGGYILKLKF